MMLRRFLTLLTFAALALAATLDGAYKGSWSSDNQGGGDLTLIFSGSKSSPKAQVSFTNEGETIPCEVKSVKLDGSKLTIVMDYEAGGGRFEANILGTVNGKSLSGTYSTKSVPENSPGDTGTWKASAS